MDDINIVVRFRLQEDRIMKNLSSNLKLKDQIWKTITEHAVGCLVSLRYHGLVSLTQLSLGSLGSLRTVEKIWETFQALPGTLQEIYTETLQRIPASDWELSRAAFSWLNFSNQSLTLDELNDAVALEEKFTVLD